MKDIILITGANGNLAKSLGEKLSNVYKIRYRFCRINIPNIDYLVLN